MLNVKFFGEQLVFRNISVAIQSLEPVLSQFLVQAVTDDVVTCRKREEEWLAFQYLDYFLAFCGRGCYVPLCFLSFFRTLFQFSGHFDADFVRLTIDIYDGIHNIDHLVEDFLDHRVAEAIFRQKGEAVGIFPGVKLFFGQRAL